MNIVRDSRFTHLPQVLKDVEELPTTLLELFKKEADIKTKINLIIYIPSQRFLKKFIGSRFVPEQALIFTRNTVLQVKGRQDEQSEGTLKNINAGDISYIRVQLLLLYGKIDIFQSRNGSIAGSKSGSRLITAEYNTTSFYMIKPGLRDLIKNTWKDRKLNISEKKISTDINMESAEFKKLPFKVKSGMRYYALHPEEYLQEMIFQPEIRRFRFKLIPKTLIAFTNKQVIILEDLLNSPYGWIITYFQKNREINFELKHKNSIVSILNLNLGNKSPDDKIQFRFEEENANRFLEYWDKLK